MSTLSKVQVINGEVIGTLTRRIKAPIKVLEDCVIEYGQESAFEVKEVWYFRRSYTVNQNYWNLFESARLIERLGSINAVMKMGVNVPDEFANRRSNRQTGQVYRIKDRKINKSISEAKSLK